MSVDNVLDKAKIDSFWQKRTAQKDPRIATHFKNDGMLGFDVAFIKNYLNPQSRVLDLGCGTGAITNHIANDCAYIRAVDKVGAFLASCTNASHIEVVEGDITTYRDENQYDLIIIFGVMNYVEAHEAEIIYQNCFNMLRPGGHLIVKHACGVKEDVLVDKFSEDIGEWYHALYRYRGTELDLMSKAFGKNVVVEDIYPAELNRWENTHFYAFVGRKG